MSTSLMMCRCQKEHPGRGTAGVPASDRGIGGNLGRPRPPRIVGSDLDELICIKSFTRERPAQPVVIAWYAIASTLSSPALPERPAATLDWTKAFAKFG